MKCILNMDQKGPVSVIFKEGVETIERVLHSTGCTGLTSVTFPEGLTSIGERAFYECTGLTSVTFPEGLTSIGRVHSVSAPGSPR